MICPNCHTQVDPKTNQEWLRHLHLDDGELKTPLEVLAAVFIWDQSVMWETGQSVLPTELRDAVAGQLPNKLRNKAEAEARR